MARYFRFPWGHAGFFLAVRSMLLLAMPIEGMLGYGDFVHFYRLAELGRPFLDYWVEFPPVFPFLINLLFGLSGGREHAFDYLLIAVLTLAQAGNLVLFGKLAMRVYGKAQATRLGWIYFAFLIGLSYGWWYFDPLAVSVMLLGLYWLLVGKDGRAGVAIAAGILTKWFPALTLGVALRFRPIRRALSISFVAIGVTLLAFLLLYLMAPDMTMASLRSQISKGSWETVWALLDGNLGTGNFGPEWQRYDPTAAGQLQGNPPKIPSTVTSIFFAIPSLWLFNRVQPRDDQAAISLLGLIWCIFLIWSPGWSPQWILYLIPIILLSLELRDGLGFCLNLAFVSLLEWPILLSRGRFDLLWLPVIVRTLLLLFLAQRFYRRASMPVRNVPMGGAC